jgi:hypothetical protein
MLSFFARHEGAALLALLLPFLFLVPFALWLALFVGPLVTFVAVNRGVHGTLFAPDV